MTGINFLINENGEKSAVQIDLKKYGKLWEDCFDAIKANERVNEQRESLRDVKLNLKKLGKLNEKV